MDYQWSQFCAEPVNTVTGLMLLAVPIVGLAAHGHDLETRFRANLLLQVRC